jgi:hypothetical protein
VIEKVAGAILVGCILAVVAALTAKLILWIL